MRGHRWPWQALFWVLYGAASLVVVAHAMPLGSGMVFVITCVVAGLWAGSECIRAQVLRRGWLQLPGWSLAWRLVLLALVISLAVQGLTRVLAQLVYVMGWISFPPERQGNDWAALFGYSINGAIMLWLWSGAWVARQYLLRWRHGEVAQWRAEAAQRQLEVGLLRAQMNPHFVFNALNNVRALINEDPARARDMVTRLSNTLRYTLQHSQHDRVPLEDELAVVRDYVALLQMHHEERLVLRWFVAPDTAGATLPPMVLQALVENAVKHGVAQQAGAGRAVDVRISRVATQPPAPLSFALLASPASAASAAPASSWALQLSVSNPGRWQPGTDPVSGGLTLAAGRIPPPSGGTGLGLAQLREQLARFGGEGARCEIKQEQAGGEVHADRAERVRVTVTIAQW